MKNNIPSNWNEKSIEDVTDYVDYRGKTPQKVESGVFLITARNIKDGRIDYKVSKEYISKEDYNEVMRRAIPKVGDVLITTEAPLGNVAQIDDANIALAQRIIKYRGKLNILDNDYLKFYLSSDIFQSELIKKSTGSTVKGIKGTVLHKMKIIFPPLKEQQKIAEILSTWDLAIEKQVQLIEKKKEFKKGLMQRLSSCEVRFKEFNDKWKPLMIKDIANLISELNKADEELVVLSCTKYDGLVESLKYFGKQMFSDDTSKYKKVWKNDFAYATNHIEEGSIGVQRICDVGLVSPMYTVFRVDDEIVDIDYLFYLLKTERYISIYKSLMSASVDRRGSLRWPEFSKIKLTLPSIHEQKKITEVLISADKEIELLEKELEALKLQKKGLMQRLLTGEVRVKV